MIRYFRINDPYRLTGLFLLLFLLCLPQFIYLPPLTGIELKSMVLGEKVREGFIPYFEVIDHTPPLASWFYALADWAFGRSLAARHIAAFFILFLQGAFLGWILIQKKAFTENTWIPSFVFSILTLIAFDVMTLTADLAAFGFLLLALNNLFKQIEFREQRDETILNLGLYLSFASLFTFSYIIYFPGILLLLLLFTRTSLRKYLLLVFGFLLPHALLFSVYFVFDWHIDLMERFYQYNFALGRSSLLSFKTLLVLCSVPLVYLWVSVIVLNRNARLTKYQSQLLQVMLLWFAVGFIHAYLSPDLRTQTLLPMAPAVSFMFTYFFLLIRRRKLAEINGWVFVIGIASTGYFARYEFLPADWRGLLVPATSRPITQKKILLLEDDPGIWINNRLAPPFVNPELSRRIFNRADEYTCVLLVSRLFTKDPPEIIVDPQNQMQGFFNRIPGLKKDYRQTGKGLWERVSN